MSETTYLGLPLIDSSQSQKHITHNEALARLDAAIQLSVVSRALASPPPAPAEAARYLVAAGASGDWVGHDGHIASWTSGAWMYFVPAAGWRMWCEDEAVLLVLKPSGWSSLGAGGNASPVLQNIPSLGINATADANNRLLVSSAASLFTHAGSGTQIKLNKNTTGDTASLVFQTNWGGRAEFGLAGDDNFHVKVSADGTGWREALLVDGATGALSVPFGFTPATLASLVSQIPEFSVGSRGLVPPSDGSPAKVLRGDGTWALAAAGGGTGTVTGPSSTVPGALSRFSNENGTALKSSAVMLSDEGIFDIPIQKNPGTPLADRMRFYADRRTGRAMPSFAGATGRPVPLQPSLASNRVRFASPVGGTATISMVGLTLTPIGTATAAPVATTSFFQSLERLDYLVTGAATFAIAGFRTGALWSRGMSPGRGGFFLVCRWGAATGVATPSSRAFVGLCPTMTPSDVQPSSRASIIGMGWDSTDVNVQIMCNDATGTATKIDLGDAFPVPVSDRDKVYELSLYAPPNGADVTWEVVNPETGDTAGGVLTSDLPAPATLLSLLGVCSAGGTLSVAGLSLMHLYLETEL